MILMPCSRFNKQGLDVLQEIRHISSPLLHFKIFVPFVFPGMTEFVHSVLERSQLILFSVTSLFLQAPSLLPSGLSSLWPLLALRQKVS